MIYLGPRLLTAFGTVVAIDQFRYCSENHIQEIWTSKYYQTAWIICEYLKQHHHNVANIQTISEAPSYFWKLMFKY